MRAPKFVGNKPTPAGPDPDATHLDSGASKKAKGKAPGPAEDTGPKTAEVLAWEEKVKTQGDIVRELKAKNPKSAEDHPEIAKAVDELKKLKSELASYQQKAKVEAVGVYSIALLPWSGERSERVLRLVVSMSKLETSIRTGRTPTPTNDWATGSWVFQII